MSFFLVWLHLKVLQLKKSGLQIGFTVTYCSWLTSVLHLNNIALQLTWLQPANSIGN